MSYGVYTRLTLIVQVRSAAFAGARIAGWNGLLFSLLYEVDWIFPLGVAFRSGFVEEASARGVEGDGSGKGPPCRASAQKLQTDGPYRAVRLRLFWLIPGLLAFDFDPSGLDLFPLIQHDPENTVL